MIKKGLPFVLFLCALSVQAQVQLVVTSVPADTPAGAKIYVAGSFNNWNPAATVLNKSSDGKFTVTIPETEGIAEYKFTRGSWETAEGNSAGNQLPNRSFTFTAKPQTINHQILSWPKPQIRKSTASPNVKILNENYAVPQLQTTRRIWIYLPADYETSKRKYPVVYMHDGQNLFDELTSFSGEWKVDETLDQLFGNGGKQAIVVGIDNGGSERLNEYSPWKNATHGGGKGGLYADFLANTLKPYIDKTYRTRPQARHTALMGSSMGGLITFYTGMRYPQKFGKLGIFSPSFWFAKDDVKSFIANNSNEIKRTRFYFLAGRKESAQMTADVEEIVPILLKNGARKKNIQTKFDDEGTHSESYWAKEFPAAYRWLLGL
ncbi:putative alpha-dextrin endo-1, 6-alpha-glucosidase [Flavobacteriaceae bacterium 3519-10]|nr:putative alpha-dextrin endo-1, 6-alpha-glucosidase [Flavobacteriaceae bacterium 3519-10]